MNLKEGNFMNHPVIFNISIGSQKPHSGKQPVCPFCQPESLTNILEQREDMIWLMNKYPVLDRTWPTVIIETEKHDDEFTRYNSDKLHDVFSFLFDRWLKTDSSGKFKSVICFRNYGPFSGGSQRHPHSQIMGFKDYDYKLNIDKENFLGPIFHEDENCYASLSSYPICGMGELNVTLKSSGKPDTFADTIQTIARFILHDFPIPCTSYNLFFYHLKRIHVKIFPRYTASPLYMGYRITHVMDSDSEQHMMNILKSNKYFGD